jgi:hypothetical protein
MHTVEFIPDDWMARMAWATAGGNRMVCVSRPITIERRTEVRRQSDIAQLLQSLRTK